MTGHLMFGKKLLCCFTLVLLMTVLTACGGPAAAPQAEHTRNEVAQKSVEEFVASAKKNPKNAAQNLSVLMESLEAYASEYEGPYIQLRDTAKELQSLYQSSAAKDKIEAQLDALKQQAESL
ncbi:hypothetical protein [Gimesia fumaroli]|uniref:Uncharacterized protein n=1 Tax=Gimesia fumaroli TaxID=2527976 RepID=A0A518I9B6_9PLAN|nr:hypothetical protein [Gimesia fumaroli]QDV49690.1 hypothetical protein Enr17x_17110 [Gimesia fumaroli]